MTMNFRTPVDIKKSNLAINYQSPVFSIGSCFTNHIGERLSYYKFPVIVNPFGTLYNPVSVKKALEIIDKNKTFKAEDLNNYNEKHLSFHHDTTFSNTDINKALTKINKSITKSHEFLRKSKSLFITFGTAFVYKYKKTNEIVSNCHKIPAKEFDHFMLSPNEIIEEWKIILDKLQQSETDKKFIFTVSPVRHWKDGAVNNQLSKSILIYSIHELIKNRHDAEYFPSYEIFMDELRDYRFYAEDMIHAGNQGINYVWEKFQETYISDEVSHVMKSVEKLIKATQHKPYNPKGNEYKTFLTAQLKKAEEIDKKYPNVNIEKEKNLLKNQLQENFGNNNP